jgi:hypothetical protein
MKPMPSAEKAATVEDVCGKEIRRADSELTSFSIRFADGTGLLLKAAGDAANPQISVIPVAAEALPGVTDAVCAVDWGWISGSTITRATASEGLVKFQLEPAGPLAVSALVYQGAPFLAFQPFRPAR